MDLHAELQQCPMDGGHLAEWHPLVDIDDQRMYVRCRDCNVEGYMHPPRRERRFRVWVENSFEVVAADEEQAKSGAMDAMAFGEASVSEAMVVRVEAVDDAGEAHGR